MRVGVYIGSGAPQTGGGYSLEGTLFRALVRSHKESQHTFVVFSQATMSEKCSSEGIEYVSLQRSFVARVASNLSAVASSMARKISSPNSIFRVVAGRERRILASGIDVMWCLSAYGPTLEIPYFITVWDLQHLLQPYFPEVSAGGNWELRHRDYTVALRRASMVFTGTDVGRSEIEHLYQVSTQRIRVLPLPASDFAVSPPAVDVARNISGNYQFSEEYLLYPAQFWPHKNHVGLLQAIRLLRDDYHISLQLILVGFDKGNLQHVKRLTAELDLTTQVHFLGFVSQADLISLYQNAFALVFPTFFGPDNLPPLEAFALGCPVVASGIPGAQEQLGDAALLFDPKSEREMALTIKSLHENPTLRKTLIQRGLDRVSKWSADDYVRSVFAILDEFECIRRCWGDPRF
jgi:glycosyltransferase involved in cell wall biosynthesis